MKHKITPGVCYMAGLLSKSKQWEKNSVGIQTSIVEIELRFIEIALKELEIEPSKIMMEESEGHKRIYFYHSRVSKQLRDICAREVHIFKKPDKLSSSYVAGMFDAAGHIRNGTVTMSPMTPSDTIMLGNLGIHTRGKTIANASRLVLLIKGQSVMLEKGLEKK